MFERTRGRMQLQAMKRLAKKVPRKRRFDYLFELDKIERRYSKSINAIKRLHGIQNKRMARSRVLRWLVRSLEGLKSEYRINYSWEERVKSPYTWSGIGLLAAGLGLGLGLTLGVPDKDMTLELEQPREVEVKTLDELIGIHYRVETVEITKGLTIDGRYRGILNVQAEHSGETYLFNIMETDPEVFERLALYFMAVKEMGGTIEIPDPLYMMANGIGYPKASMDGIKFDIRLDEEGNPVYCFEGDDVMFNFLAHQPLEEYIQRKYPNGLELDIDM